MRKIASRFWLAFGLVGLVVYGCSSKSSSTGFTDGGTTGASTTTTGSGTTTSATTGGGSVCEQACARLDSLHCPQDTPGECVMECTSPLCAPQRDALATCSLTAPISCDSDQNSQATGCDPQLAAWVTCVLNSGGQ